MAHTIKKLSAAALVIAAAAWVSPQAQADESTISTTTRTAASTVANTAAADTTDTTDATEKAAASSSTASAAADTIAESTTNSSEESLQTTDSSEDSITQASAASQVTKTITLSVERFTIGEGYLAEPQQLQVAENWNCAQILDEYLTEQQIGYRHTGSPSTSFYLSGFEQGDTGQPEISEALRTYAAANGYSIDSQANNDTFLGEFDYSMMSGWLYSVNGAFASVGMSDLVPEDGAVIRIQFSLVGYGADLGENYGGSGAVLANKEALTQQIAKINGQKSAWLSQGPLYQTAYDHALAVLTAYDSSQSEVDLAGKLLQQTAAVEQAADQIAALGDVSDLQQQAAVAKAQAAFDALGDLQAFVPAEQTDALKAAEDKIAQLTAAQTKEQEAADKVCGLLTALAPDTATTSQIQAARKAYDALSETAKQLISATDLAKLSQAETQLAGNTTASAAETAADTKAADSDLTKTLTETKAYILQQFYQAAEGQSLFGSEWLILGLAREDTETRQSFYETYYQDVLQQLKDTKGVLNERKYTEYSRVTLAVTALGKDAQNLAGYNMFTYLSDYQKTIFQGINGAIFALLAVDSDPDYHFVQLEGVESTTRQKLLDYIISKKLADGGWALFGTKSDVDITAMVLQALAPYQNSGYDQDGVITTAIASGVQALAALQNKNACFGAEASQSVESIAQVITALTALHIDPKDPRFIKNGRSMIDALLQFHIAASGFMHVLAGGNANGGAAGGSVNGMATEQAYYALVAYERYLNGQNSLYEMQDSHLESNQLTATTVSRQLQALPVITSVKQAAAVNQAAAAYAHLSDAQKLLIDPLLLAKLQQAKEQIAILQDSAQQTEIKQAGKQTATNTAAAKNTVKAAVKTAGSSTSQAGSRSASAARLTDSQTAGFSEHPVLQTGTSSQLDSKIIGKPVVKAQETGASTAASAGAKTTTKPAAKDSGWDFSGQEYTAADSEPQTRKVKKAKQTVWYYWAVAAGGILVAGTATVAAMTKKRVKR